MVLPSIMLTAESAYERAKRNRKSDKPCAHADSWGLQTDNKPFFSKVSEGAEFKMTSLFSSFP
jgi:hypothetical protein